MSRNLERRDLLRAVEFIQSLCGAPAYVISFIIQAYCTFVLLELYQGNSINIPLIGKLTPKKSKACEVTYKTSTRLRKFIYMNRMVDVAAIVAAYRQHLAQKKLNPNELERYTETSTAKIDRLSQDLKRKEYFKSFRQIDTVRVSLLRYLQREFPYGVDWKHPTTAVLYSHSDVERAVKQYRLLDPDGYEVLYSVWVAMGKRNTLANLSTLTPVEITDRLYGVIDSLILLIIYKDIAPEGLSSLYSMGILSLAM